MILRGRPRARPARPCANQAAPVCPAEAEMNSCRIVKGLPADSNSVSASCGRKQDYRFLAELVVVKSEFRVSDSEIRKPGVQEFEPPGFLVSLFFSRESAFGPINFRPRRFERCRVCRSHHAIRCESWPVGENVLIREPCSTMRRTLQSPPCCVAYW